jgi:hypothetical protein
MNWLASTFWLGIAKAQFTPGLPLPGKAGVPYQDFNAYFTDLVSFLVRVAVGIAIIVVIYAGFLYSRSQGKTEVISQAKELVAGALTGLAILLLIRVILPTLNLK